MRTDRLRSCKPLSSRYGAGSTVVCGCGAPTARAAVGAPARRRDGAHAVPGRRAGCASRRKRLQFVGVSGHSASARAVNGPYHSGREAQAVPRRRRRIRHRRIPSRRRAGVEPGDRQPLHRPFSRRRPISCAAHRRPEHPRRCRRRDVRHGVRGLRRADRPVLRVARDHDRRSPATGASTSSSASGPIALPFNANGSPARSARAPFRRWWRARRCRTAPRPWWSPTTNSRLPHANSRSCTAASSSAAPSCRGCGRRSGG